MSNCVLEDSNKKLEIIVENKKSDNIKIVFFIFTIIWIFIVAINKFYLSLAFPILLIPIASFGLGIINSDTIDDQVEVDIFSTTFITMGLVISLPLLTFFNKDKMDKDLNHIIFLAMIATLFSYIHIWFSKDDRYICKVIRSCFETIAVTLYIFALTIFFILT